MTVSSAEKTGFGGAGKGLQILPVRRKQFTLRPIGVPNEFDIIAYIGPMRCISVDSGNRTATFQFYQRFNHRGEMPLLRHGKNPARLGKIVAISAVSPCFLPIVLLVFTRLSAMGLKINTIFCPIPLFPKKCLTRVYY